MVVLATLLEGRLSATEENIVDDIFETQVDLQLLFDDIVKRVGLPPPPAEPARDEVEDLNMLVYKVACAFSREKGSEKRHQSQVRYEALAQIL